MKSLILFSVTSLAILVQCQHDFTQQVTLSCPGRSETDRGPPGVPGKRGSKGEAGSRGG